jgi:hypothetical protein
MPSPETIEILRRHGIPREAADNLRKVVAEVLARTHECSTLVDLETGARQGPILCEFVGAAYADLHIDNMAPGHRYLFLHSHPNGAAFSPKDGEGIWSGIGRKFSGLVVVTAIGHIHLLSRGVEAPNTPTSEDAIGAILDAEYDESEQGIDARFDAGDFVDDDDAWGEHSHVIWLNAHSALGLRYDRIHSDDL